MKVLGILKPAEQSEENFKKGLSRRGQIGLIINDAAGFVNKDGEKIGKTIP